VGIIKDGFASAWRQFVTDGVPASGANKPSKAEASALGSAIELQIAAAAAAVSGDGIAAIVAIVDPLVDRAEDAADRAEAAYEEAFGDTLPPYNTGRSTALASPTGAFGEIVAVRDQPFPKAGVIETVFIEADAAGTAYFKIYNRDGTAFTKAGPDIVVTVPAAGAQSITLPSSVTVKAGQYLGIYAPGVIRYQGGAPAGLTYGFFESSASGNVDDFTATSSSPAFGNDLSFGAVIQPFTYQEGQGLAVDAVQITEDLAAALSLPPSANMGVTGLALVSGSQPDKIYVRMEPAPASGIIDTLTVRAAAGGSVEAKVYSFDGASFALTGQAAVAIPAAGLQTVELSSLLGISAGQYLAIYGPNIVQYQGGAPAGMVYGFLENGGGDAGDFTPTSTTPSFGNQFAYGAHIRAVTIAELQSGLLSNLSAISDLNAALGPLGQPQIGEVVNTASVTMSGTAATLSATVLRDGVALAPYTGTATVTLAASGKVRYDIIALDMLAGTFSIVQGVERPATTPSDPTVFSPEASLAIQQVAIAKLRVTNTAVSTILVYDAAAGTLRATESEMVRLRLKSRDQLRRVRAALSSGGKVAIIGLGDSITGIQYEPAGGPGDLSTAPNGIFRDRATTSPAYLTPNYGADYIATVATYTAVQLGRTDDGAGQVHTRIGWNWNLVAALEARGYALGTTLTYDNFGIAGAATSALYASGAAQPWLNNVAALVTAKRAAGFAVLVTLSFGMNELAAATTGANIAAIAKILQTAGANVIVMGLPRPKDSFSTLANRQYTNRALARGADFSGSAFVPILDLVDGGRVRAMGIFADDLAEANGQHHPGVTQLNFYGRELVRHVVDGL
jgi:hypothetical protein